MNDVFKHRQRVVIALPYPPSILKLEYININYLRNVAG